MVYSIYSVYYSTCLNLFGAFSGDGRLLVLLPLLYWWCFTDDASIVMLSLQFFPCNAFPAHVQHSPPLASWLNRGSIVARIMARIMAPSRLASWLASSALIGCADGLASARTTPRRVRCAALTSPQANEETRRAMNKSFQTSGGTVLSTNWDEVGTTDYEKERQAPNGM